MHRRNFLVSGSQQNNGVNRGAIDTATTIEGLLAGCALWNALFLTPALYPRINNPLLHLTLPLTHTSAIDDPTKSPSSSTTPTPINSNQRLQPRSNHPRLQSCQIRAPYMGFGGSQRTAAVLEIFLQFHADRHYDLRRLCERRTSTKRICVDVQTIGPWNSHVVHFPDYCSQFVCHSWFRKSVRSVWSRSATSIWTWLWSNHH